MFFKSMKTRHHRLEKRARITDATTRCSFIIIVISVVVYVTWRISNGIQANFASSWSICRILCWRCAVCNEMLMAFLARLMSTTFHYTV